MTLFEIQNDSGKFAIGTSTIATVLRFPLMSVGERANSPDPTFGNGLVPLAQKNRQRLNVGADRIAI